jgi:hypothetical protein
MRPMMLCALVTRPPLPASPLLLRSAACAAPAPDGSPGRCAASAACPGAVVSHLWGFEMVKHILKGSTGSPSLDEGRPVAARPCRRLAR